MIVAGVGTRTSATADEIVMAVTDCCRRNGIDPAEVAVLASLDRAQTMSAMRAAALRLGAATGASTPDATSEDRSVTGRAGRATLVVFSATQLQRHATGCSTFSDRSMAATGVPSVAEAAALAAAGPDGMLLAPRVAYATVTVALAIGSGASTP